MDLNSTIIGQSISFILFIWFCMKYIWPNIIKVIEDRKKEINDAILNIENSKKQIEISKIHAENILNESHEQARIILEKANKNKLNILEQARLFAQHEKKKILLEADVEINLKKEKIQHELMKEINSLSITIAKKIIQGSMQNNNEFDDLIEKLKINL